MPITDTNKNTITWTNDGITIKQNYFFSGHQVSESWEANLLTAEAKPIAALDENEELDLEKSMLSFLSSYVGHYLQQIIGPSGDLSAGNALRLGGESWQSLN